MIGLYFIYVGEPKDSYIREGIAEYEKRLSSCAKLRNVCVRPAPLPERPSAGDITAALEKEAFLLITELSALSGIKKIALCVEGKQMSSEELSDYISSVTISGYSGVAFVIGSSFGLSESVKSCCDLRLSFSRMTFPHSLMRLMLCEQTYRAFSIAAGGKYHK
ncbi:Ribosomal RNA large subunit methyltransferase H [bioreactor metagenome]|uniref:Ribosomal RNA large subunit methyltransferase H n=1 Tax=bioreactor metagenome TaxID=1076179 RepID=A0A645GJY6_9ZZZZ|nr:23S rRNA (pseudouridine(1915)-N(3))-methyltransferase RlmH [Oscillospiraceae bacterium]